MIERELMYNNCIHSKQKIPVRSVVCSVTEPFFLGNSDVPCVIATRAGFLRQKKMEKDVIFCKIKDRTFFPLFCLTNAAQQTLSQLGLKRKLLLSHFCEIFLRPIYVLINHLIYFSKCNIYSLQHLPSLWRLQSSIWCLAYKLTV
jgi:hypothetical protein